VSMSGRGKASCGRGGRAKAEEALASGSEGSGGEESDFETDEPPAKRAVGATTSEKRKQAAGGKAAAKAPAKVCALSPSASLEVLTPHARSRSRRPAPRALTPLLWLRARHCWAAGCACAT
jgi:hypothetical protein